MAESEKITLEIPAELADELRSAGQSFTTDLLQRGLRDLHIEQALLRYREGGISFGAAAELAGVSQSELATQAYARGMQPSFSDVSLAEDTQ